MTDRWICEACGEVADGDLCIHCGQRVPISPMTPNRPGSYADILGWPKNDMAARVHWGAVLALMAVLSIPVLLDRRTAPWIAAVAAFILFRMFIWGRLKDRILASLAKLRF